MLRNDKKTGMTGLQGTAAPFWHFLTPYRKECFAAPALKMAEALFELLVPLVVAKMVDEGIEAGNEPVVVRSMLLMMVFAVFGTGFAIVAQYFAARAAAGAAANLRDGLFRRIQTFSYETLDSIGTGNLITHMNSDVNAVQNAVNLFLRLFLRSPFIVLGACIMACTVDGRISLLFFGVVAVLGIIVYGITRSSLPVFKTIQEKLAKLTLTAKESMEGARVIRAFSREEQENRRFGKENDSLYDSQMRSAKLQSLLSPATSVVINAGFVLLLYVTGLRVNAGTLTCGGTIALLNYMGQILTELIKLANLIVLLTKAGPCIVRLNKVLSLPGEQTGGEEDANIIFDNTMRGDRNDVPLFSVKDLYFSYAQSSAESLSGITFDIKAGETIGIIGGTGSGKTTLLELLGGFYPATSGSIEFCGENINKFSPGSYRSLISRAPQRAALFSGTVESNLRVADPDATKERMDLALDTAMAGEFVSEKGGLLAEVKSGGSNFSGGQRQRLAIARALTREAAVYMLDDSFSALDMATEKLLAGKLKRYREGSAKNPAVIIVSQRASSLRYADRILVLEDGRVDAFGTKEELLEKSAVFREIYETQYEGGGPGGAA